MAWYQPGEKPSCKPMMVNLLTHHICVSRIPWVNTGGYFCTFLYNFTTNNCFLHFVHIEFPDKLAWIHWKEKVVASWWLPWPSLQTLNATFNVSSDDQGGHPDYLPFHFWVPLYLSISFQLAQIFMKTRADVLKGVQYSLEALQVDYIDLYLIHSPIALKVRHISVLFVPHSDPTCRAC